MVMDQRNSVPSIPPFLLSFYLFYRSSYLIFTTSSPQIEIALTRLAEADIVHPRDDLN
jgi:hypothetical protein